MRPRQHHFRVTYSYDGSPKGKDAWFTFDGTAWQFAKVLFSILRNHELYGMTIRGNMRP